ncbi:NAD(P)-binding domain-containing protein [Tamlana sp. s12]|uniref:NADPH-dependent F420 reductase n=1 Tax=Tamlana sp. s12 TaxID=1630406 RepID=UPI0007FED5CE|nr:NAD(P)-binding domain-containing protein [Tamlana sp. s12]OBQ55901.1 NADP oxidoreductase [Tamlana sp. s12]QQY83595.1 NAD(P)-binding domain-containing protein [Tamlana sp. s12]
MTIGIIGKGKIAGSLGKHWAKAGHEILFGSKHPDELRGLVEYAGHDAVGLSLNAIFKAQTDAYLLAMPFHTMHQIAELYAGNYENNVIIDATNPDPESDGELATEVLNANYNASEYTAIKFGTAKTVKAFNSINPEDLEQKAFRSNHKMAIPFATQESEGKKLAIKLIEDIGFDAFYIGDLSHSNIMEPQQALFGKCLEYTELKRLVAATRSF